MNRPLSYLCLIFVGLKTLSGSQTSPERVDDAFLKAPVTTAGSTPAPMAAVTANGSRVVLTFGTFDLLHVGHVNLLKRAKELAGNGRLVVGVSTDSFSFDKKGKNPVISQDDRLAIVRSLSFVDEAFFEESMERKPEYLKRFGADILAMGDDWSGKFDNIAEGTRTVYLPRARGVSTTELIGRIRNPAREVGLITGDGAKPHTPHRYNPELPLSLYQLVYDFQSVMENFQIPFFFSSGTLLGAVRHGGIIPWDDDADCCLLGEHVDSFVVKAIPNLTGLGYEVSFFDNGWRGFKVNFFKESKLVTFLDIFFMYADNEIYKYPSGWPHMKLSKDQIFPLGKIKFGLFEINAPNDIEGFLNDNYGTNWKTRVKRYNHLFGTDEREFSVPPQEDLLPAGPLGPIEKRESLFK